jgi:ribosomal protein L40E
MTMALWESFGRKASESTAKVVQKAQELSEISKYNMLISDEERNIEDIYYQAGKIYISLHRNDYETEFAEVFGKLDESEKNIENYRKQIQNIKGVTCCEKCGAEVPVNAAFCSSCGAPIPRIKTKAETESEYTKCSSCGTAVKKGMKFCTACGARIDGEPSDEQPSEETVPVSVRKCPECGAELKSDVEFCTECGKKL